MSEGRIRKEAAVADLVERLSDMRCMVLTDFTGIGVGEMCDLRRSMRDAGVTFRVVKNTIAKRAFDRMGIGSSEDSAGFMGLLEGPTAIACSEDEVSPVRVIRDFSRRHDGRPVIKGGLVAGRHLDAALTTALGDLPGREQLLARVVGSLNGPLSGFVSAASNIIRGFQNIVRTLSERDEKDAS